jgi:hypothetical protein
MSDTGIVTFDYAAWSAQFPELAGSVTAAQALGYFSFATLYLDNTPCSLVWDAKPGGKRATILNMVTAHVAKLLATISGQAPSGLVGRISAATEGSVNVTVEMPETMSGAWWMQTQYGAMAWQMLAPYRTALYVAPPQVPLGMQSWPGGGVFGRPGLMPFNGGFPWPR